MARRLLFMPDYTADPLWDLRSGAMVELDQLPIHASARQAIRAWAARWEALAKQEMEADDFEAGMTSEPAAAVPSSAWEHLERDGRSLWVDLQQRLGSEYQVGWVTFPDGTRHVQWDPEGPIELCPPSAGF